MQVRHMFAMVVASVLIVGCASSGSEPAPAPAPRPAPAAPPPAATPPPAASGAAAAIQQRQNAMRQIGGIARGLGSATDLNAVHAQGQQLVQIAAQLPSLFPAGSGAEAGVRTTASPAIWSNPSGFSEQVRNFSTAAQAIANAPTIEAAQAASRNLGCQTCHSQFRSQ